MIESFVGEEEKGSTGCSLDLHSRTGELLESFITPSISEKYAESNSQGKQAVGFQNQG